MKLLNFSNRFPDEKSCRDYLKDQREKQGLCCKKCDCQKMYWFENAGYWECSHCRAKRNLCAGTIMEKSKMPLRMWFECIHLMTATKKSFSALEMQRQLQHKRYEPVWYMMQKIRRSMGKRDKKYQLSGTIELDDSFFEIVDLTNENRKELVTGRGSLKQQKVLVMVESEPNPLQQDKFKKKRVMGFVKMVTMDDLSSVGVNYEIKKSVAPNSTIISDAFRGFSRLNEVVYNHIPQITPSKQAHEKLPWVHTTISNAKKIMLGVHHSIGKPYLQNYLNEFCYKLNRRTFSTDLFDSMLTAGASDTWY
jgi:hypothetical protein